jgi:3-hydroxybutyryl-CoA dehydrogenase
MPEIPGSGIVGVVGAGTMGAGIAQLSAAAGCDVYLFDLREGAAEKQKQGIAQQLGKRVTGGKLTRAECEELLARLVPVSDLQMLKPCGLVIEAIAESLTAKRELFAQLEALVAPTTILASNTSSLSVSAIGRDLTHRGRVVGMHFFNPVHSMKLVEIVSGVDTDPQVADRLVEVAEAWGKVPVRARSTPGFIVNRIARPFYAEALLLIQQGGASAEQIDTIMRGAGFRMGPCELMDLIGHDVNSSVTESVFRANYCDRRFTPSIVQQELVDAGRFGRKSGRGFYDYTSGTDLPLPALASVRTAAATEKRVNAIIVRGAGALADELEQRFEHTQVTVRRQPRGPVGLVFMMGDELPASIYQTSGRVAAQLAISHPNSGCGVFDLALFDKNHAALAVAYSRQVSAATRDCILLAFAAAGVTVVEIDDSPALLVARTVCMLINEAADAVQQKVCTVEAANMAMRLGVNYPAGPFDWLEMIGTETVVNVLQSLGEYYGGERYRISPWLQERRWRELSGPK